MHIDKIVNEVVERDYQLIATSFEYLLDVQNQELTPENKSEAIALISKDLLKKILVSSLTAVSEVYKRP